MFPSHDHANIQAEIKAKGDELEEIRQEIKRLEQDRALGMSVVEAKEEVARKTILEYREKIDELKIQAEEVENKKRDLVQKEKRIDEQLKLIKIERDLLDYKIDRARDLHKRRDFIVKKLVLEEQTLEKTKVQIGAELLRREQEIAARERDFEIRKERLDTKEHELYEREVAINDKYNTLLQVEKLKK